MSSRLRVVLAPDKFKGTLTAPEAAEALARGIASSHPAAETVALPVADGGDGTLDVFLGAGFSSHAVTVTGPRGQAVSSAFALSPDGRTAVVETARTSGLAMMGPGPLDPLGATSRGVGEAIRAALDAGAREIVVGLGGSACTDGGAGMLEALGVRLLDDDGGPAPLGGGGLARLESVSLRGLDPRLAGTRVTLACDVSNPLLGPNGAAAVYGPQKGASPEDVRVLESALARWDRLLAEAVEEAGMRGPARTSGGGESLPGPRAADLPGAGAAGGIGYAALSALGARMRPGIELVRETLGLEEALRDADLVITGEGRLDEQSLQGKAPSGVLEAARRAGVPAAAVCGVNELPAELHGFAGVFALMDTAPDAETALRDAARLLEELGARLPLEQLAGRR
ncbi:glycerate kinase [Arthrobacter sp. UM1]|uniref:glycerate kinase n=1 Tax=Arthrobacter sp. UM1 TaxID=2766776 RepID=UPI001CF6C30E|nr:glycerate kinase [Arthrobacter sp. UM1]MCB4209084.1 glycerate kinase [Arthrobacter sp. UM1]